MSSSAYTSSDIAIVRVAMGEIDPKLFEQYRGGWRNEISTALIDAVYSAQQQYETKHGKGVHARLENLRKDWPIVGDSRDSLRALAKVPEDAITQQMGRNRVGAGKAWSTTKAVAILEAAVNLSKHVDSAEDARRFVETNADGTDLLKNAYTRVRGLGPVTFN